MRNYRRYFCWKGKQLVFLGFAEEIFEKRKLWINLVICVPLCYLYSSINVTDTHFTLILISWRKFFSWFKIPTWLKKVEIIIKTPKLPRAKNLLGGQVMNDIVMLVHHYDYYCMSHLWKASFLNMNMFWFLGHRSDPPSRMHCSSRYSWTEWQQGPWYFEGNIPPPQLQRMLKGNCGCNFKWAKHLSDYADWGWKNHLLGSPCLNDVKSDHCCISLLALLLDQVERMRLIGLIVCYCISCRTWQKLMKKLQRENFSPLPLSTNLSLQHLKQCLPQFSLICWKNYHRKRDDSEAHSYIFF